MYGKHADAQIMNEQLMIKKFTVGQIQNAKHYISISNYMNLNEKPTGSTLMKSTHSEHLKSEDFIIIKELGPRLFTNTQIQ